MESGRHPGYPVNPDHPGSDSGRNKDQAQGWHILSEMAKNSAISAIFANLPIPTEKNKVIMVIIVSIRKKYHSNPC